MPPAAKIASEEGSGTVTVPPAYAGEEMIANTNAEPNTLPMPFNITLSKYRRKPIPF